jgi:hypothetical protein
MGELLACLLFVLSRFPIFTYANKHSHFILGIAQSRQCRRQISAVISRELLCLFRFLFFNNEKADNNRSLKILGKSQLRSFSPHPPKIYERYADYFDL